MKSRLNFLYLELRIVFDIQPLIQRSVIFSHFLHCKSKNDSTMRFGRKEEYDKNSAQKMCFPCFIRKDSQLTLEFHP